VRACASASDQRGFAGGREFIRKKEKCADTRAEGGRGANEVGSGSLAGGQREGGRECESRKEKDPRGAGWHTGRMR
jgi:hypothetical protein